jgi:glycosyltransferase involved in cell wall biosynthesis
MRLLFCLPTTALSGGVKVVFEIANRLADAGETAHIFSFAGPPRWRTLRAPILPARDLERADVSSYDFVLVSNAFLLPSVLLLAGGARVIFLCQDYETFHHAVGATYQDFMAESETIAKLYALPVPIIATSRAVQGLIKERLGKDSIHVPVGIDKAIFRPHPPHALAAPARVLMVGNYLMPYKGMKDGLDALRRLSSHMPVQLVLVTQEQRGRRCFDHLPFPVELHYCPADGQIPDIMATCDVYCCTSWYEGLGLPALEAFACGLPVVSTRTYGVSDYGIDGVNLLLAQPNDAADLHAKLAELLGDSELRDRLRRGGFDTMRGSYDWGVSVQRFRDALAEIDRTYRGAGSVDAAAMRTLLSDLEAEGGLTPVPVFREFQALSVELDAVLRRILEDHRHADDCVDHLGELRNRFASRTANPRAQYYDAFKSKYDLCGLVLALAGSESIRPVVNRLLHPKPDREDRTPISFSEIRYRE